MYYNIDLETQGKATQLAVLNLFKWIRNAPGLQYVHSWKNKDERGVHMSKGPAEQPAQGLFQ